MFPKISNKIIPSQRTKKIKDQAITHTAALPLKTTKLTFAFYFSLYSNTLMFSEFLQFFKSPPLFYLKIARAEVGMCLRSSVLA